MVGTRNRLASASRRPRLRDHRRGSLLFCRCRLAACRLPPCPVQSSAGLTIASPYGGATARRRSAKSRSRTKDDVEMFDLAQAHAPKGLRLVGRWIQTTIPSNVGNPVTLSLAPDHVGQGIACCPPPGSRADGFALVIEAHEMPLLDPNPPF